MSTYFLSNYNDDINLEKIQKLRESISKMEASVYAHRYKSLINLKKTYIDELTNRLGKTYEQVNGDNKPVDGGLISYFKYLFNIK